MMTPTATKVEDRVLDLLNPYREDCQEDEVPNDDTIRHASTEKLQRKLQALAHNLAFLVENHRFVTERSRRHKIGAAARVSAEDVFIVVQGWDGNGVVDEGGVAAVLVRYPATIHHIIHINLAFGDNVIDKLNAKVDHALQSNI